MNEQCPYCRRHGGEHEDGCPKKQLNFKDAEKTYDQGYDDGRRGKPMRRKMANNKVYQKGHANGIVALEEANG